MVFYKMKKIVRRIASLSNLWEMSGCLATFFSFGIIKIGKLFLFLIKIDNLYHRFSSITTFMLFINLSKQPTVPLSLTEFIVNAYVELRKESKGFTSGIG